MRKNTYYVHVTYIGRQFKRYVKYQYFYNIIDKFTDDNFDFCTIFGSENDLDYTFIWKDGRTWQQAQGNVTDYGWNSICGAINMTIDMVLINLQKYLTTIHELNKIT